MQVMLCPSDGRDLYLLAGLTQLLDLRNVASNYKNRIVKSREAPPLPNHGEVRSLANHLP